jgi:hypothetical protein
LAPLLSAQAFLQLFGLLEVFLSISETKSTKRLVKINAQNAY